MSLVKNKGRHMHTGFNDNPFLVGNFKLQSKDNLLDRKQGVGAGSPMRFWYVSGSNLKFLDGDSAVLDN